MFGTSIFLLLIVIVVFGAPRLADIGSGL
ncbi:MAG: twin-arginine translocase TatA/TatE family subunit [Nitrospinae bacterium]|nr:twin-arginine translocase TatA/TatE family subunit [Nitrospinota bacterium]MBF0635180.1 twin-arginine translocase TatA/TatE family subunit [Nitrospinota bacterium]